MSMSDIHTSIIIIISYEKGIKIKEATTENLLVRK